MKRVLYAGLLALIATSCGSKTVNLDDMIDADNDMHTESLEEFPLDLGIYYGWPSLVNGSSRNLENAVSIFDEMEYLILGAYLERPDHPDHENTEKIISMMDMDTEIYGYIDLGDTPAPNVASFSLEEIGQIVREWRDIGVDGIFYDRVSPEFNVDHERLSEAVSLVSRLGLKVMINTDKIRWAIETGVIKPSEYGHSILIEPFMISMGDYLPQDIIDNTSELVRMFSDRGYDFHGIAHYDKSISDERRSELYDSIREKAKEIGMISVGLSHVNYASSGTDANELYLYD
ncbi:MAG: hypothetical protein ACLFPQ_01970 [Candidatus Woesearchaeota archaeon]